MKHIDQLDADLAHLEGVLHGADGNLVTAARATLHKVAQEYEAMQKKLDETTAAIASMRDKCDAMSAIRKKYQWGQLQALIYGRVADGLNSILDEA